jgi:uncharacterized protein YxeA
MEHQKRRKGEIGMKKIIIALLALMLLVGCTKVEEIEKPKAENVSRFVTVETTSTWKVVVDKDTHVMYAVSYGGYNAGTFTLLVDADGKPLIYERGME